ncbi:MAG: hypothetical protein AAFY22_11345 [Pseudomonadota bacterium]
MKNALNTAAAALIAAIATTTGAAAQDTDVAVNIAATSAQTEAKIFELVMAKAEATVSADIAALNHASAQTLVADATEENEDVVVAGVWF